MKAAAIVFFVLAGLTALIAIKNVFGGAPNRPGEAPRLIGYVVGSFLLPLILLIVGLVLHKKSKQQ